MEKVQRFATFNKNGRTVFTDQCLNFGKLEHDEQRNTHYLEGDLDILKFQIEILKLDTV